MTRRYTQRNKSGIRGKSTLLTAVKKMENLHKKAKANRSRMRQNDSEGTLNSMAEWLVAASKCPPRHYGKVWNDEKELIVRKCRDMYLDAQKYNAVGDAFMGFVKTNESRGGSADGDGRFIPLSRLRFNMATAKWDFTNKPMIGKDPYWDTKANVPAPVRQLTDLVEISDALGKHDEDMVYRHVTYGPKVTNTIMDWRLANGFK